MQAQHEEVKDKAVELHDEGGELKASDESVRVGVVHVLFNSERASQTKVAEHVRNGNDRTNYRTL